MKETEEEKQKSTKPVGSKEDIQFLPSDWLGCKLIVCVEGMRDFSGLSRFRSTSGISPTSNTLPPQCFSELNRSKVSDRRW